jgi:hypothetical protein
VQQTQFRKASSRQTKTGKGLVSVIVFFLVRQVRLKHRLHGNVIRDRARAAMPGRIAQYYVKHINAPDGPLLLTGPAQ